MNDAEWRSIVLTKIEKIEEGQDSIVQMFYAHNIDGEKQLSKIKQNHISLKEKVHVLWGAIILVATTVLTAFIGKKL